MRRRLSSEAVAAELGASSQWVRDELRRLGIPLRLRGGVAADEVVPRERLEELYVARRMTLTEVGAELGRSPSGVRKLLVAYGIPARPSGGVRRDRLQAEGLGAEDLAELYLGRRLSVPAIAARLGVSADTVSARLHRHGIPTRRGGQAPPGARPLTEELLVELHVRQGLSAAEIARRVGGSAARVREHLRRHGIGVRRHERPPPQGAEPLTKELLVALYVERRLSTAEVARRVGGSPSRVAAALHRHGISVRPPGARRAPSLAPLTKELLTQLYVVEGLSAAAVAAKVGGSDVRVLGALRRYGLPVRSRGGRPEVPVTDDQLAELYAVQRLSHEAIAARLGTTTNAVRVRVRAAGIRRTPLPRPKPPAPPKEVLEDLYLAQGLTVAQIARRYGTAPPKARRWLAEAGVPVAERTSRTHRRVLPRDVLEDLYVGRDLSAEAVAAELGVPLAHVLRSLHDHGIPVRLGGLPPREGDQPTVELVADLYADPEVSAVLAAHGVPRREEPGSIAERFPEPVRPGPGLLRALYDGVGLSARHVELLTGQPAEQVLDALHAAGIPVRPLSAASPWRLRLAAARRRLAAARTAPSPAS